MRAYLARRVVQALVVLVLVSLGGFAMLHLAPGGPVAIYAMSPTMSAEDMERLTRQLGLDQPLHVQYAKWAGGLLTANWGRSYRDGRVGLEVIADRLRPLLLPAATLGVVMVATWSRYTRASMLEVIGEDYIRTARAKGVSRGAIVLKHALKNALIPLVTLAGLQLPLVFSGALVTETVFTWPGMGRLFVDSIGYRDYPVLMGILMLTATLVVVGNLAADLVYARVDPRVD